MNATLISPTYPLRGGIAESGSLLEDALNNRNGALRTITYRRQYPKFLFPGKSEFIDDMTERLFLLDALCKLDALNPLTWLKVARSIKTDVVIIRYWTPALALCIGTLAWLLRKKKIIFIVDNITPHEKFPFSKFLTKYALRKGKGFFFFSRYVKNDFLKLLPRWDLDKFTEQLYGVIGHDLGGSIPNPCRVKSMPIIDPGEKIISKEEAKKMLDIPRDQKVILFFGLVRKYKGLDTLIKAMPDILKEVDVRLLIVGEFYDDVEKYYDLIDEVGLTWFRKSSVSVGNEVIIVSKYVEKVTPYFCAADVVVLPYKHATQSAVVRLAQYFNKPCIVTDVGGLSEMVNEQTGYVVEENNISDAVINFFLNQEEDEVSDRWDFSHISTTWDNVVEAIEELCEL